MDEFHPYDSDPSSVRPIAVPSFWDRVKRRLAPLDLADLLATARRRTGLDEPVDPACEQALRILVNACNAEANLSLFGQIAARQHLLDLLATRLQLLDYWRQRPAIQEQEIQQPIFITGMPRSGSTFLHELFSQDLGNRVPQTWEVMFPLPPPTREEFASDPRIAKTERRLRWLRWIQPGVVAAHPIGARLAQECIAMMSYSFRSDEFLEMFWMPSYEAWLRSQDMGPAYRFHRRFLKHLQWRCPGERWVLKAPDHVQALPALFETYPDARVVVLHRDPLKVLGSVASLTALLRGAFSHRVDPRQLGADEARILADKAARLMEFRERHPDLAERFVDVRYLDFVADPMATVRSLYDRFGLTLSVGAEARMAALLAAERHSKRPRHEYRLADFGFDPAQEAARFAGYRERFAIASEAW